MDDAEQLGATVGFQPDASLRAGRGLRLPDARDGPRVGDVALSARGRATVVHQDQRNAAGGGLLGTVEHRLAVWRDDQAIRLCGHRRADELAFLVVVVVAALVVDLDAKIGCCLLFALLHYRPEGSVVAVRNEIKVQARARGARRWRAGAACRAAGASGHEHAHGSQPDDSSYPTHRFSPPSRQ